MYESFELEREACAVEKRFTIYSTWNDGNGEIMSPGYPRNYPDNINYTWILRTGHFNANVIFRIMDFNIGTSHIPPCDDYLQVKKNVPHLNSKQVNDIYHELLYYMITKIYPDNVNNTWLLRSGHLKQM